MQLGEAYREGARLAGDPKQTRWISPLLVLADAGLCALIIFKVPCDYYTLSSASLKLNVS